MSAGAFSLEVDADGVGTLWFDHPGRRVNVFTREVLAELEALLAALASRTDLAALVLASRKADHFCAGADVDEIAAVADPEAAAEGSRYGHRLFGAWAALPFPTVAAVAGACVGGGTELALASRAIVVADSPAVRLGLPEVRLGIVPGWGGCVRLPRRIGIAASLELIASGKLVSARRARELGLADALLPAPAFLAEARRFARRLAPERGAPGRGDLRELLLERNPVGRGVLFDQARKQTLAKTAGRYPAPLRAIEVVRVGVTSGEHAGLAAEARAIGELATGPVAKNLVHLFRSMEAAKRDDSRAVPRPVASVAVVGAGVMGGGIAQLLADQGNLPVRLADLAPDALARAMRHAASLFERQVRRRRLSPLEARRKLALLRPTLGQSGFGSVGVVIEAVVERLEVKQQLLADLAQVTPPDAVLATNTSSLSVDAIAARVVDPGRVVGMHFFNPVDRMPLVEVIAGPRTSTAAAATVAALARRLGKTPIHVTDTPGFLVNRLLVFYMTEAVWLLREGHAIEDVDRAMTDWGMPLGPLALADEVGLDVAAKVSAQLAVAFGDRLQLPPGLDAVVASGRLGTKSGNGLYRYEGVRRLAPDPEIYTLIGVRPHRRETAAEALADRMVLPMVNEAARCLAERVVATPAELDLAMVLGTGFPPFRGGLCRWADACRTEALIATLERLAATVGRRYEPAPSLRRVAELGGFYRAAGGGAAG